MIPAVRTVLAKGSRAPLMNVRKANLSFLDTPNPIKARQAAFQKGKTCYLRGEADPTYWRTQSDNVIVPAFLAVTGVVWVVVLGSHFTMWTHK